MYQPMSCFLFLTQDILDIEFTREVVFFESLLLVLIQVGLGARKLVFGVFEQQPEQTDQRLCYSLFGIISKLATGVISIF